MFSLFYLDYNSVVELCGLVYTVLPSVYSQYISSEVGFVVGGGVRGSTGMTSWV